MSAQYFFTSLPYSSLAVRPVAEKLAVRKLSGRHVPPAKGARPSDLPSPTTHITSRGPCLSCRASLLSLQLLLINGMDLCVERRWFSAIRLRSGAGWIDSGGWHGKLSGSADKSEAESCVDLPKATCPPLNGSKKSIGSR